MKAILEREIGTDARRDSSGCKTEAAGVARREGRRGLSPIRGEAPYVGEPPEKAAAADVRPSQPLPRLFLSLSLALLSPSSKVASFFLLPLRVLLFFTSLLF